jgi:uncharacterized protein (TIGR02466 family)
MFQGKANLNHEMVAEHCRHIVGKLPKGDALTEYTTYFDNDLREETHNQPWFNDFANQMKDTYIDFIRTMWNFDTDGINRHDIHLFAWVNVYSEPHSHAVHNHVKSRLSGTYYVSTDSNSEPITFYNPNMSSIFGHGASDGHHEDGQYAYVGNKGGQTEISFYADNGDFLLWPSYMVHAVPQGRSRGNEKTKSKDYERISISFNLQHAEDLGSYHHGDSFDYGVLNNE